MAALSKSDLAELTRIQERVNSLFEQALLLSRYDGMEGAGAPGTWQPAVDILETGDAYLLRAELPGVAREEVEVEIEGRRLALSGRRRPPAGDDGTFLRMERGYGPFLRTFELGSDVDPDAVTARLRRGILEVELPKRSGAVPIAEGDP